MARPLPPSLATPYLVHRLGSVLACLGLMLLPGPAAWAQAVEPDSFLYSAPSPPNDQGAPTGRRQGGASR